MSVHSCHQKRAEAPRSPQVVAREKAAEDERSRRRRVADKTSFMHKGAPRLRDSRYIIVEEMAGVRGTLGGLVAVFANLDHLLELSVAQNPRARRGPMSFAGGEISSSLRGGLP